MNVLKKRIIFRLTEYTMLLQLTKLMLLYFMYEKGT